jgi:hypothetical protein
LRNGARPWPRFEVGQFAHLAAFKKFPSQEGEFESFFRLPLFEPHKGIQKVDQKFNRTVNGRIHQLQ